MLLIIQFPFSDSRSFLELDDVLSKPSWPIPSPDYDFVRSLGCVRLRKHGGINGWVGENEICEVKNSIKIPQCPTLIDSKTQKKIPTRIAFQRLYFDGRAVGKFEIGISLRNSKSINLNKKSINDFIHTIINLPIRIRTPKGDFKECLLVNLGKHLVRLYHFSTTKSSSKFTYSYAGWLVRPGIPILFFECKCSDDIPVPYWSKEVKVEDHDFSLHHCLIPYKGGQIRLWFLSPLNYINYGEFLNLRRLRIYLLRLHAEHECLRLILRNIMSKDIIVKPRSNISDKLQYYFNESTRRIGILESKSTSQFDEEICELARESLNYISPGQKDALENKIRELDFRKTVARKIEDYADKWTNANITIIENMEGSVMGDIFKDVNQSVIANRGSIAEGKILLKNQGKTDIADAIAEIGKIINSASENILSIDKKKECTDLLNGITDQAKEPEPNKNILRSLGSSLFSILETVAPIAQSAKKAIDILKSWWL